MVVVELRAASNDVVQLIRVEVTILRLDANWVVAVADADADQVDLNRGGGANGVEHRISRHLDTVCEMRLKTPHELHDRLLRHVTSLAGVRSAKAAPTRTFRAGGTGRQTKNLDCRTR